MTQSPTKLSSLREGFFNVAVCDFCGHKDFLPVAVRGDGMQVLECLHCGLAFLAQLPKPEFLSSLYGESYFRKDGETNVGYQSYGWTKVSEIQLIFGPIIKIIEKHYPLRGIRFLEVGCATGELLFLAREAGASVLGVEGSEWAAQTARRRFDLEIINTTLEAAPLTQDSFDVTVALEVIEHTLSPSTFMAKLASVVRPGGLVVISTPNYRMAKIIGNAWAGFQTSFEHLYFLSDEFLTRLGHRFGLSMVEWYTRGSGHMPTQHTTTTAKFRRAIKKIPGIQRAYDLAKDLGLVRPPADLRWNRFGQGHTVLVVFQKNASE
ncbi:class I SAM-dependent methyltransferase [Neomoorella mulderi]|uniref:Putative S-adenosylmethionine-dependent methyltransferase n=1 Tax=Moorella mulderi DSM 14980 TaxID=1122241 RepID=A0A151AYU8_9FIRM|nr:class I SAM-dependent methyltransferase [Moorella mulderi]KYH32829.1 putative S-adenosylmethionine-dependent methyltransferase [Moorella mulderi DSM 14980]